MTRYTTSSGEVLELNMNAAEAEYFARLQALAEDVTASVADLVMVLYSAENPILEQGPDGMGWVTRAVFSRPTYHACADLLQRKEAQRRQADPAELEKRFNVSVAQAAAELGISERSVRRAIKEKRLPGLKLKGQHFTTQAGLGAYRVGKSGPKSDTRVRRTMPGPLEIVEGSSPGHSLEFKTDGKRELVERRGRTVRVIRVTDWTWAVVKTNDTTREERGRRLFVLRPAGQFDHMDFGPLGFDGGLRVANTINRPQEVSYGWKHPISVAGLALQLPDSIPVTDVFIPKLKDKVDVLCDEGIAPESWSWIGLRDQAANRVYIIRPAADHQTLELSTGTVTGGFEVDQVCEGDTRGPWGAVKLSSVSPEPPMLPRRTK